MARIGKREHQWMYGGPNCWVMEPYRFSPAQGAPPAVLRRLVEKGWMWAEKRETRHWMPRARRWSEAHSSPEYWCGLTDDGFRIIESIKEANALQNAELDGETAPVV